MPQYLHLHSRSCIELLLCLPLDLPENKWEEFQAFVQVSLGHEITLCNMAEDLFPVG